MTAVTDKFSASLTAVIFTINTFYVKFYFICKNFFPLISPNDFLSEPSSLKSVAFWSRSP